MPNHTSVTGYQFTEKYKYCPLERTWVVFKFWLNGWQVGRIKPMTHLTWTKNYKLYDSWQNKSLFTINLAVITIVLHWFRKNTNDFTYFGQITQMSPTLSTSLQSNAMVL